MLVFYTRNSLKACAGGVLLAMACAMNAHAAIYYVDAQRGNDSSDGQSLASAWRTLGKANSQVQPGDTVYIREGTYVEVLRPGRSGTSGNAITYASYQGERAVITGVTDAVDLRNRHYIVLDGLRIEDVQRYWVNMEGDDTSHSSTHNVIANCHMEGSRTGWAGIYMKYGIEWNRITGCTFIGVCGPNTQADAGPADLLYCRGGARYNLIEGNRFAYGSHQCLDMQGTAAATSWNVIRNNEFTNPWHSSLAVDQNADWTLVEGNKIIDSGADYQANVCGSDRDRSMPRKDHKAIQLGSSNCVVRNNVLINNGQMSMSSYERARCLRNRVYFNTFYANFVGIETNTTEPVYGNIIKNNVFFEQVQYDVYHWGDDSSERNRFVNNRFTGASLYYYPDGATTLDALQAKYPQVWYDGITAAPAFVDASGRDLRLTSNSPLIDAGAFLTTTTSSGSGTLIPVQDAAYFYDGWSIPGEQGDLIQLEGQAQTARIVSIDYSNNRITVDRTLSWSAGQGVSLPYYGAAPDIGAFEYASVGTTYTLSVSGVHGTVTKTPNQSSYSAGTTVTVQAIADDGYAFTNWSGDLSGSTNPTTITMNSNKSVTANFAAVAPTTYTLSVSGVHGTVTKTPNQSSYNAGTTVTVQAIADDGYAFTNWSGDLSGSTNPTTITMNANKSITAVFTRAVVDDAPPVAVASSPQADAVQVPRNSLVVLQVSDEGEGVDADTVTISIDGTTVYSGGGPHYGDSDTAICRRTGSKTSYTYTYQSKTEFAFGETVTVRVNAADLNGNAMSEYVYSFTTEMWAFGGNRRVSWGPAGLDKGHPATASDSDGNLWVVWHAGPVGQRDIYVSMWTPQRDRFSEPTRLTSDAADQANPDIAIGPDDKLYVVWQDNRANHWDVYLRTSSDGVGWSAETRITDSDGGQTAPSLAVDNASGCHVAWEDDSDGHSDIYVASSNNGFVSQTIARVTSNIADQTDPDIAADASGNVYIVWTDVRSGSADVYGAASNNGPWTNVALVTGAGNQYAPALATEAVGARLHLAWVHEAAGDIDVRYAATEGLSAGPLVGINLADDTSGADQLAPTVAVAGSLGNGLRVFVCWQDGRNATNSGQDTDLYFVEVKEAGDTNVLVGDGGIGSGQSEPALGVDSRGFPYVVWTDDRDDNAEIYQAGTTSWDPEVLASQAVTAAAGGTVGVAMPSNVDDVSVVVPPAAASQDVTITVTRIQNAPAVPASGVLAYEFAPSGLQFSQPVTITIPYAMAEFGDERPTPWWYDSRTGGLSQEGITDIEHVALSSSVAAMRFKTTHFTPYYLISASAMDEIAAGSAGGGCSLSYGNDADPVAYFVPYLLIVFIMVGFRIRDARRRARLR